MASLRIPISEIGNLRRKMIGWVGKAKTDEVIGSALKAGAEVHGQEIERTYRTMFRRGAPRKKARSGMRHSYQAVKKGMKGRMTKDGSVYFSAVDRKRGGLGAPQASWLHRGRRVQPAKPWIFNDAISRARTPARQAVMQRLWRAVEAMFSRI